MKVAIIGSRDLKFKINRYVPSSARLIISGGARGIDSIAEAYADENGVEKLIIKPDYKKYGRSAPLVRNRQIIESADLVLAFWDGESRGTMHSVKYAIECGKNIELHEIRKIKKEAG